MIPSSHRLRAEEKKLFRKTIFTFTLFLLTLFFAIYVGLPLFAKVIVTFSSLKQERLTSKTTNDAFLFPPILESTFEATNSSRVSVSGLADKESTVKIFVNSEEKAKVLTNKDGRFIATNIRLTEGTNSIFARTLKNHQESSPSNSLSIIYKKTPPKLEVFAPKEGEKFSGETKEITITGETEPDTKVTINERFVIVDGNGKFNYPLSLKEGENIFKIIATDAAYNQTTIERKVTYSP